VVLAEARDVRARQRFTYERTHLVRDTSGPVKSDLHDGTAGEVHAVVQPGPAYHVVEQHAAEDTSERSRRCRVRALRSPMNSK
jgi:hypothetical protein